MQGEVQGTIRGSNAYDRTASRATTVTHGDAHKRTPFPGEGNKSTCSMVHALTEIVFFVAAISVSDRERRWDAEGRRCIATDNDTIE